MLHGGLRVMQQPGARAISAVSAERQDRCSQHTMCSCNTHRSAARQPTRRDRPLSQHTMCRCNTQRSATRQPTRRDRPTVYCLRQQPKGHRALLRSAGCLKPKAQSIPCDTWAASQAARTVRRRAPFRAAALARGCAEGDPPCGYPRPGADVAGSRCRCDLRPGADVAGSRCRCGLCPSADVAYVPVPLCRH
jgi:hypothetical protein